MEPLYIQTNNASAHVILIIISYRRNDYNNNNKGDINTIVTLYNNKQRSHIFSHMISISLFHVVVTWSTVLIFV